MVLKIDWKIVENSEFSDKIPIIRIIVVNDSMPHAVITQFACLYGNIIPFERDTAALAAAGTPRTFY